MYTLLIEHAITSFETWSAAFARFAQRRLDAGVLAERVARPLGEPTHVVVELDFAEAAAAERFLDFLRASVWADTRAAPALASAPSARVLRREPLAAAPAP